MAEGGVHWPPYLFLFAVSSARRAFDCFGLTDDNIDRKGAASKRRVLGSKPLATAKSFARA